MSGMGRLHRNHVQADRIALENHTARIIEQAKFGYPTDTDKARSVEIAGQKLFIQPDEMIIVLVDVSAEDHSHHQESVLRGQECAIQEEAREHIEIRYAHAQHAIRRKYATPLRQRLGQLPLVIEMLKYMRSIKLFE